MTTTDPNVGAPTMRATDRYQDIRREIAAAEAAGDTTRADQLMRAALPIAAEIREQRLQEQHGA